MFDIELVNKAVLFTKHYISVLKLFLILSDRNVNKLFQNKNGNILAANIFRRCQYMVSKLNNPPFVLFIIKD